MSQSPKRRELNFHSFDEVIADAERLAGEPVETSGSYSLGQILEHLARTMDVASGHTQAPPIPLWMRSIARLMRPILLALPMKPGFKLPSNAQSVFWPTEEVDAAAGLKHLCDAVERFKSIEPLPPHPIFGKMSRKQSDRLQCGHCALHLSFVHPAGGD